MAGRFSDIQRAEFLMAQKEKYDQWLRRDLGERSQLYRETMNARGSSISRTARVNGWIIPFGAAKPSSGQLYIATKIPSTGTISTATPSAAEGLVAISREAGAPLVTQLNERVVYSNRVSNTTPAVGSMILKAPRGNGERPAILKIIEKGAQQVVQSRITGRYYPGYPNAKSVSSPFGQSQLTASVETQEAAVTAIKNATPAWDAGVTLSFQPQKLSVVTMA